MSNRRADYDAAGSPVPSLSFTPQPPRRGGGVGGGGYDDGADGHEAGQRVVGWAAGAPALGRGSDANGTAYPDSARSHTGRHSGVAASSPAFLPAGAAMADTAYGLPAPPPGQGGGPGPSDGAPILVIAKL